MKFYIKEAREQARYSQKQLAEIIGVAPNTFHGYESGKHDPKSDQLIKIARACNVTVDYLMGLSDDPHKTSDRKKASDADFSAPEEGISLEESNRLLVALGYIKEGEQLSSDDLTFLTHIVGLLDAWFSKGH